MVKRKFYKAAPPPFYMGDISAAYKAPCTETIIIIDFCLEESISTQ